MIYLPASISQTITTHLEKIVGKSLLKNDSTSWNHPSIDFHYPGDINVPKDNYPQILPHDVTQQPFFFVAQGSKLYWQMQEFKYSGFKKILLYH